jgi:fatty acid/phospholipid biosynthesis enzyme
MHDEVSRGLFRTILEDLVMSTAIDEMNNTTSTIKHRAPLGMGVPLRIVSSHQGTQKKKIYSWLKSNAKMAKRQKRQRKAL